MEIKRIALIGLGAIGAYVAPGLEKAVGHDSFFVVAEGARKERLETQGTEINGTRYFFRVADAAAKTEAPVDLIVMAVKTYQRAEALEQIRFLVGENTIILPLMNGVDNVDTVAQVYGPNRAIYGLCRVSVNMRDHAVKYDPAKGSIHFGERKGNIAPYSDRVAAVDAVFTRGGINHEIPEDMERDMWLKFCSNVSENMAMVVLGNCFGSYIVSEDAEQLRQMGYLEPLRIAMKLGVDIDETDMIKNRAHFKVAPFSNKPSTRLDIEAKRPTEVEAFAGVVMRLGRQVGVETPVNTWLYHAIRLLEMMNRGEVDEQKWREAGAVFPEY